MLQELKSPRKATGAKQVSRMLRAGRVERAFVAQDADPRVTEPVERLCQQQQIPVERVDTMAALGAACGISVGSAVAALLRE